MSNFIYIGEYSGYGQTEQSDTVPVVAVPPLVEQQVIVSSTSIQAKPFSPNTRVVQIRMGAVAICASWGTLTSNNPTATTANMRIDIYEDPFFRVVPGTILAITSASE